MNFKTLGKALGQTADVLEDFGKKDHFYEHATKAILRAKGYANFELRKIDRKFELFVSFQ